MQYAHLEFKGSTLSEAQKKMLEMYDTKKKKDELEKKDKVSSMMTKDSVKKEDEKEEEKPDMRSKYAMINLIKNKLRSAGQRDPMVMAVDACEERTPAKDDPAFDIMRPGGKNSPYNKDGTPKPKVKTKPKDPNIKSKPPHGRRPPKKDTEPKYNPYGTGTANPENMSGSTGP